MKIALFPGSFDPITIAHVDILERALPLFDKIVVGIGLNSSKQSFLSAETREEIVSKIFKSQPYERAIAQINQTMMPDIETILLLSKPEYSAISSTIVRDILRNHGDVSKFVPKEALDFL